ncbi:hypothetical protein C8Q75DRAFT_812023 [Abortiporus biennis]|nr:hypothetical protein C8Q75DRAFT_789502 [Abortiporus biennis]KAI0782021.1 hypothetical protein C8Q75DRAFT_812023 [Abortiporus biennis]
MNSQPQCTPVHLHTAPMDWTAAQASVPKTHVKCFNPPHPNLHIVKKRKAHFSNPPADMHDDSDMDVEVDEVEEYINRKRQKRMSGGRGELAEGVERSYKRRRLEVSKGEESIDANGRISSRKIKETYKQLGGSQRTHTIASNATAAATKETTRRTLTRTKSLQSSLLTSRVNQPNSVVSKAEFSNKRTLKRSHTVDLLEVVSTLGGMSIASPH